MVDASRDYTEMDKVRDQYRRLQENQFRINIQKSNPEVFKKDVVTAALDMIWFAVAMAILAFIVFLPALI